MTIERDFVIMYTVLQVAHVTARNMTEAKRILEDPQTEAEHEMVAAVYDYVGPLPVKNIMAVHQVSTDFKA